MKRPPRAGPSALALAALALLLAPVPARADAATDVATGPAVSSSRIATNADFHARRTSGTGIRDAAAGRTVVAWNGPHMRFDVRTFDERTRTWEAPVTVARAFGRLDPNLFHDYGVMTLLPDGRYGIFAANHTKDLRLIAAPTPHSVEGRWTDEVISRDANMYPLPVVVGSTVYVFYSRLMPSATGTYRTYRYITSTYDRATSTWGPWSEPATVVDTGETPDRFNEVYGSDAYLSAATGRIYLSWTMAGGMAGHNGQARHLYVAYLDLDDGTMHAADGTSQGRTVGLDELAEVKILHSVPAPIATSDYARRHPVQNSAITTAPDGTLTVVLGHRTSSSVKALRFVDGRWTAATVATGAHNLLDLRRSGDALQVLYTRSGAAGTVVLSQSRDNGETWPVRSSVDVDLSPVRGHPAADAIYYTNFIEDSAPGSVQAVGAAIGWADSKDHETHWPVFALRWDG